MECDIMFRIHEQPLNLIFLKRVQALNQRAYSEARDFCSDSICVKQFVQIIKAFRQTWTVSMIKFDHNTQM